MSNRTKAEIVVADEIANGEYGEDRREQMVVAVEKWLNDYEASLARGPIE